MDVSLVSVVCCQVEVSATSWSLQRSPTECGVSKKVWSWIPEKWGGLGPQGAVEPWGGGGDTHNTYILILSLFICHSSLSPVFMLVLWLYLIPSVPRHLLTGRSMPAMKLTDGNACFYLTKEHSLLTMLQLLPSLELHWSWFASQSCLCMQLDFVLQGNWKRKLHVSY
jgi:hypothetical protein